MDVLWFSTFIHFIFYLHISEKEKSSYSVWMFLPYSLVHWYVQKLQTLQCKCIGIQQWFYFSNKYISSYNWLLSNYKCYLIILKKSIKNTSFDTLFKKFFAIYRKLRNAIYFFNYLHKNTYEFCAFKDKNKDVNLS